MEVKSRYVTIKHHINGAPKQSDFEVQTVTLSLSLDPGSNDVLVKNLYVSIDPYQLNRMKDYSASQMASKYALAVLPGQAINSYGVGRVVASANPSYIKDDLIVGLIGWEEYTLVRGEDAIMIRKLDTTEFPLSYHVSTLGLSGLTAYGGFFNVCKPKKGETVFVSAASGSVGNIVGQYAKLLGCYVVGCAGTKQKVDLLTDKLGFDAAFNYKETTDLKSTVKRYFPDGIDMYFDNVGGEMLEAAVENMNMFGRVAVCGVISEYTDAKRRAGPNMLDVVYKRITIQGFLAADYMNDFLDFISKTSDHIRNGRMHVIEDISHSLESIPLAFEGLFAGDNIGKKIVQIADI
ncbi:hypothetical protein AQUCO_00100876v1 [Aquilegia coerulea]|uniref:Enoyl reductase (ER) domain-containing protein n=1 Tax=Aquilegia coerulea TaxID=218851 RepID=A0A2G5FCJ1_AQUCA|nr:hypothetical protein AQUCO_00100876v1 [Aquilegia coerulea]